MSTVTKSPGELTENNTGTPASPTTSTPKTASAAAAHSPVCVEIPVRLRGLQPGASADGAAESSATFTEDTQTLILLPRGAVVRLAAKVSLGQQVILTNLNTDQHVHCKVVSIRASETARGYVELEFTHRTSDFWGGASPALKAPATAVSQVNSPTGATVEQMAAALKTQSATEHEPSFDATIQGIRSPAGIKPTRIEDLPVRRMQIAETAPRASASPASVPFPGPERFASVPAEPRLDLKSTRTRIAGDLHTSRKRIFAGASIAAVLLAVAGGAYVFVIRSHGAPGISAVVKPVISNATTGNDSPEVFVVKADGEAPASQSKADSALAEHAGPETRTSVAPATVTPAVTPKASKMGEALRKAAAKLHLSIGNSKIVAPSPARALAAAAAEEPPAMTADESSAAPTAPVGGIDGGILPGGSAAIPAPIPAPATTVRVAGQTTPPRAIATVRAQYPVEARAAKIEGDVTIQAEIDATGKVTQTKVISGPSILQSSALDAMRQWRYEPARLDGRPVAGQILVTLKFRLH